MEDRREVHVCSRIDEWYERQEIEAWVDGEQAFFVSTHGEAPEDNNISRMGIAHQIERLVGALGGRVIFHVEGLDDAVE